MKQEPKKIDLGLKEAYEEMFMTQEQRDDKRREKIIDLPLDELQPFKGHPFRVTQDGEMNELLRSIHERGIISPCLVRPKPEGGYEIIANNLYFVCKMPGLAGNVGFLTYIGDSHFTDMVVVDYTVGVRDLKWSNRYTRCHVWGGPVKKAGTDEPEYLPNSIAFDLAGADCLLDDCYADTAMIGFRVRRDARIFNCGYFNNWVFKMDGPEVFVHEGGSLIVTGGRFSKNSPHATLYRRGENAGRLIWRDNQPLNFTDGEMKDLNEELKKQGGSDKSSVNDAKLAG